MFEDIAQFPDISRPVVTFELSQSRGRELQAAFRREGAEEEGRQRRYVARPLPEGRHRDFENVEPIIEIFPEPTRAHFLAQILVGGSDQPKIHAQIFASPEPGECALFHKPQKLRLNGRRNIGDLIQKKRSTRGAFDVPLPGRASGR